MNSKDFNHDKENILKQKCYWVAVFIVYLNRWMEPW